MREIIIGAIAGVIQAYFIIAKLEGLIKWNWFLVFSPTWGSVLILIIILIILAKWYYRY
jgi:ABC-type antimicrobial peptide transport system permease subunit